jgi:hypothetical protein
MSTSNAGRTTPTSYLVFNKDTRGYRVVPNRVEAKKISSKWPRQMRHVPLYGDFQITSEFLDFLEWAA